VRGGRDGNTVNQSYGGGEARADVQAGYRMLYAIETAYQM
jgi:hypothetical protein